MSKNNQSTAVYILKIVYPLVVICAIIALLVAGVNSITKPVIDAQVEAERTAAIRGLFNNENAAIDNGVSYDIPSEHTKVIDKISRVIETDAEGNAVHLGYCVQLSPNGFKGAVDLLAAFDPEGRVIGVDVTSTNDETKGFGTRVNEPEYESKFIETEEKTLPETVTKDYIISGATKTSKPVAQSVMTAKSVVALIVSEDLVETGIENEDDKINVEIEVKEDSENDSEATEIEDNTEEKEADE